MLADESDSGEEQAEFSNRHEPLDTFHRAEVSPESGVEEGPRSGAPASPGTTSPEESSPGELLDSPLGGSPDGVEDGEGQRSSDESEEEGGAESEENEGGEMEEVLGVSALLEEGGEEDGDTEAGLLAVRRAAAKRGERAKMRSGEDEGGGRNGVVLGQERSSRAEEEGREAAGKTSEKEGKIVGNGGLSKEEEGLAENDGRKAGQEGDAREDETRQREGGREKPETSEGVKESGGPSEGEREKAEGRGAEMKHSRGNLEGAAVEAREGETGAEEKESDAMQIEAENDKKDGGAKTAEAGGKKVEGLAEGMEGAVKETEGEEKMEEGAVQTGGVATPTEGGTNVTEGGAGKTEGGAKEAAGNPQPAEGDAKEKVGKVEEEEADDFDEGSGEDRLKNAAAAAMAAQPTGYTLSTTQVRTKVPFLLKHSLREYQHIGLDWLVTMYEKRLNGILADEMGLGKTIQTIALLAYLACEKGIWGPHLIVVPTSVMLNWETELKKWCPAFKVLTYFGSAKERKVKRQGWSKPNSFHVCITTYRLVIQDQKMFKRKKWRYLILDEAHMIKNWRSQRWQVLLNFNSKRRILLTG